MGTWLYQESECRGLTKKGTPSRVGDMEMKWLLRNSQRLHFTF
ncbi:MAG: hypothetical protein H6Q26_3183 [Bacteroidetes bacterium]|nr:hypothetical protein [Bacteroidota bacterium]